MINDFDLLLKKCKARTFKRVIRIVLRSIASVLLVLIALLGYRQWAIPETPIPTLTKITPHVIVPTPLVENNRSVAVAAQPPIVATAVEPGAIIVPALIPASTVVPTTTSPIVTPAKPTHNNRLLEVSNQSIIPSTPDELYQRSPKFETALSIARDLYLKENYTEAAIWAKKANQMNREAEESWLLYAKSYYAQGKKSEAIGVLELYLNYKDSKAAMDLIKAWK
jgi:tetratricopeptide (TPR) repeat protein